MQNTTPKHRPQVSFECCSMPGPTCRRRSHLGDPGIRHRGTVRRRERLRDDQCGPMGARRRLVAPMTNADGTTGPGVVTKSSPPSCRRPLAAVFGDSGVKASP